MTETKYHEIRGILNASLSGNSLHHTEYKHYPSGFETSKFREISNSISVQVIHKKKEEIIEREYFDPFHSKVVEAHVYDESRPSSPYKMTSDMDEYGDVAGQYFRDIITQRVPSRKAQRGRSSRMKKKTDDQELIFQRTAFLPQLKVTTPVWTAIQSQHHQYKSYSAESKPLINTAPADWESSMSHVMSLLGGDCATRPGSTPQLTGVPVPDNINMLLYSHQALLTSDSLDSLKTSEEGGRGIPIVIQNDCPFHDLKNCIIKFLYDSHHRLGKHQFTLIYQNMKLWYFDPKCGLWSRLQTKKDWSLVKILSISATDPIKLMYEDCSMDYTKETSHDKNSYNDKYDTSRHAFAADDIKKSDAGVKPKPMKMSLLDQVRENSASSRQTPAQKQQIMAERLEQRLLLSRRL